MTAHQQHQRAAHRVDVEVVLFHADQEGRLAYRVLRDGLPERVDPDDAVLGMATASRPEVSHSTSWRTEGDTVVLTYAVLPDLEPERDGEHLISGIVTSGDPTRPRPADLSVHHVAAHAARHLAYLRSTDPTIAAAAHRSSHPQLWAAISAAATLSVATHDLLPHAGTTPDHGAPATSSPAPTAGRAHLDQGGRPWTPTPHD